MLDFSVKFFSFLASADLNLPKPVVAHCPGLFVLSKFDQIWLLNTFVCSQLRPTSQLPIGKLLGLAAPCPKVFRPSIWTRSPPQVAQVLLIASELARLIPTGGNLVPQVHECFKEEAGQQAEVVGCDWQQLASTLFVVLVESCAPPKQPHCAQSNCVSAATQSTVCLLLSSMLAHITT